MYLFTDQQERERRHEAEEYERRQLGSSGAWPWDEPEYKEPEPINNERRLACLLAVGCLVWILAILLILGIVRVLT